MKKKFTFLIAATIVLLLNLLTNPNIALGQTRAYEELYSANFTEVATHGYTQNKTFTLGGKSWTASVSQVASGVFYLGCNSTHASKGVLNDNSTFSDEVTALRAADTPYNNAYTTAHAYALKFENAYNSVTKVEFNWAGGNNAFQVYLFGDSGSGYVELAHTNYATSGTSVSGSVIWTGDATNYTKFAIVARPGAAGSTASSKTLRASTFKIYKDKVVTYTVTYNPSSSSGTGTGTMTDINSPYNSGATVTVLSNAFSAPDGKEFDKWNTASDGNGTNYAPGATFTISANTTLYAQWRNASGYITVSPTYKDVTCAGEDAVFAIATDQTLNANPVVFYSTSAGTSSIDKPSWIGDLASAYNSSTNKLTIPVAANTGAARTAYFRVEKGSVKSDVVTITQQVYKPTAPTLTPEGNFDYTTTITITPASGTTVYYTLNGTDPSSSSTQYTEPFEINATTTLKAIAYDANNFSSDVVSATYTRSFDYISSISSTSTNYTVKGTVVATNAKGFVMGDGSGYIYDYYSTDIPLVGSVVSISEQKVSTYGYVYEFKAASTSASNSAYTTDTPTSIDGDGMSSEISSTTNRLSDYKQFVGLLSLNGSNYEIAVEGTTHNSTALISYPTDGQNTTLEGLSGKTVKVKGYFTGIVSNKYSVMLESVVACPIITPSVTSLTGFNYNVGGGPSASQYFEVDASNLTANITVALSATSSFEMSEDDTNFSTDNITISKGEGSVEDKKIYVRLKTGLSSGTYTPSITLSSTDADDATVTLNGTVTHTITIDDGITNGTVTASPSGAAIADETVTLTATPDDNYKLSSFTVTKAGSGTVDVTPTGANTGTFTMPADNVTVSASFVQAYAVTYAANGGSGTMTDPNSPYTAGSEVTLLTNDFTYTGHTWSSWDVKDSEQNPVTVSEGKFTMPSSAVTVTAQWTINTHDIAMPSENAVGTYTASATTNVEYGTEVTLTFTPKSGYEHYVAVWSVNGDAISGNTFNMPDEAVTVTVATHATYTVTYNANGGSGSMSDPGSPYNAGANVTVLDNGFTYLNHTFTKWNTQPDGQGTNYLPGATISGISANVTLYAQWENGSHVTYTVTSTSTVSTSGSAPLGSVTTYSSTYGSLYQLTSGNSMTLTLKGYTGQTVKSIVLSMRSNSDKGEGTLSVTAGSTTLASISPAAKFNTSSWYGSWSTSYVNVTKVMTVDDYEIQVGEDLVITIAATANSLYCQSFTINYETTATDPMVFVVPSEQTVNHTAQSITSGSNVFEISSLNITSPTFDIAYCDKDGNVLGVNPFTWFTPVVTDNEKVTYSVEANTGKDDRTAYFKVYASDSKTTIYSDLCSLTQLHQPHTYTLVDGSTVKLEAGKHYIIASGASGTVKVMGAHSTIPTNNGFRTYVDNVSVTSSQITEADGFYEVVISGDNTQNWTMYDVNYEAFICSTNSGGNITTSSTISDNTKWTISISSGEAIITALGGTASRFRYNPTYPRFTGYASGQNPVYLYKQDGDTDMEIHSPTTVTDLTIASTDTYTVEKNQILTVSGTLVNSGNLVIEDGGQLICNNSVAATVKKNISSWGSKSVGGWNFISSPISGNIAPALVTNMINETAEKYDLYRLNMSGTPGKEWENYKQSGDHYQFDLVNGMGYLYANADGVNLAFSGDIQPSNVNKDVKGLVAGNFNLVGNPYTCDAYLNQPYFTINDADTEGGITNSTVATLSSVKIPSCTGVIVKTDAEVTSVTFSKNSLAIESANNGNVQMVLSQNVATRGESSNQTLDNAIISFNEGSQLGKFYFGSQDANLYIPMDNEEYAVVSSSAQGEMPVNFKAHRDGQYTITVNPEAVEMGYLHLIDNIAGTDVDLLANPSYTFNAKADDYESRFRLVFSANMVNADLNDDFAFFSNGQLVIANEGEAILQVIDVTGRVVATESVNGTCSKAVNVKAGVYVLRLINGTNVKTQKIIVK